MHEATYHWVLQESTHFLRKGKSHSMDDLIFICWIQLLLLILNEQKIYLFGQIQTSQTGGVWQYSDTLIVLHIHKCFLANAVAKVNS